MKRSTWTLLKEKAEAIWWRIPKGVKVGAAVAIGALLAVWIFIIVYSAIVDYDGIQVVNNVITERMNAASREELKKVLNKYESLLKKKYWVGKTKKNLMLQVGLMALELGDVEKAEKYFKKLSKAPKPWKWFGIYNMGVVYEEKGDYAKAVSEYMKLVPSPLPIPVIGKWLGGKETPLTTAALFSIGRAYEKQGQNILALNYYQKLVNEYKNSSLSQKALNRIDYLKEAIGEEALKKIEKEERKEK